MRLVGKVALITGGAAGIGFAYARRFLAEGARVVVADVADPVSAARKLGTEDRVFGVWTDVSDAASVRGMVDAAAARFDRIDVLVNNAAMFAALKPRPFDEISEPEWDRVMAVNVKGVWNCVRRRSGDAQAGRRADRQRRLGHRGQGHRAAPSLRHVEGGRGRMTR